MALHWIAPEYGNLDALELVDIEVPPPGPGEVTIEVRAAGMNPIDVKLIMGLYSHDPAALPLPVGLEVAGVITALGEGAELGSGGGAVADEVIAYSVVGGYATVINVPASDVFAKPATLGFPDGANLLLVGATAADMLHAARVADGDTVVIHGASGAVGASLIQQARLRGARVIGTASRKNFSLVKDLGGEPVHYGEGLTDRVRELAPDGVDVALDTVGTDEAVEASIELVADRSRIVTIAAARRAGELGIQAVGAGNPSSAAFRAGVRSGLLELAAAGKLVVPLGRAFPLADAIEALKLLQSGHPGGKLALIP